MPAEQFKRHQVQTSVPTCSVPKTLPLSLAAVEAGQGVPAVTTEMWVLFYEQHASVSVRCGSYFCVIAICPQRRVQGPASAGGARWHVSEAVS